ncbi:MAG: hypothetical protein LIO63_01555 [Akkermansia sp.]|nr:hypothetical protein [Akkermansia sp.]
MHPRASILYQVVLLIIHMKSTDTDPTKADSDAGLAHLLSLVKVIPQPEASFEERFLYNYKERLTRESVRRSARSLLWEHLFTFLRTRRTLAYGTASSAGVFALAFMLWPGGGAPQPVISSLQPRSYSLKEISADMLEFPLLRHDVSTTGIHCGKKAFRDKASFASSGDDNSSPISLPDSGDISESFECLTPASEKYNYSPTGSKNEARGSIYSGYDSI